MSINHIITQCILTDFTHTQNEKIFVDEVLMNRLIVQRSWSFASKNNICSRAWFPMCNLIHTLSSYCHIFLSAVIKNTKAPLSCHNIYCHHALSFFGCRRNTLMHSELPWSGWFVIISCCQVRGWYGREPFFVVELIFLVVIRTFVYGLFRQWIAWPCHLSDGQKSTPGFFTLHDWLVTAMGQTPYNWWKLIYLLLLLYVRLCDYYVSFFQGSTTILLLKNTESTPTTMDIGY